MGASHIPTKGKRTDFSLQDDQIVYDYLYPYEQGQGMPISGNRIYKALSQKVWFIPSLNQLAILIPPMQFPQHPWQSWRSRYLRVLRGKPHPGGGAPRPDLVHEVREAPTAPQPASQHRQEAVAQSRALQVMDPQHASTVTSSPKRKRVPGTRSSAAASPSPSKRRMIEASRSAGPLAPESRAKESELLSRPPEPIEPLQPPRHTQNPPSAPTRSKESVSAQGARAESANDDQDAVDPNFLELPFLPSSPEPDHEELDEDEFPDVDAWIDSQLARGNADESTIISVLRSANMDQELAGEVLRYWDHEKGIPEDMPGIWTAEDDKCLEGQDARGVQRVLTKHGQDAVNSRWEYLRMALERGML